VSSGNNIFGGAVNNAAGTGYCRTNTANQGNGVRDAMNYQAIPIPAPKIATMNVRVSLDFHINLALELQDLRSLFKDCSCDYYRLSFLINLNRLKS
jgi:hypothetical protein